MTKVKLLHLGIIFDFFRRSLLEDTPVMHHRHPLRDFKRHIHIMFDNNISDMIRQALKDVDQQGPLRR